MAPGAVSSRHCAVVQQVEYPETGMTGAQMPVRLHAEWHIHLGLQIVGHHSTLPYNIAAGNLVHRAPKVCQDATPVVPVGPVLPTGPVGPVLPDGPLGPVPPWDPVHTPPGSSA